MKYLPSLQNINTAPKLLHLIDIALILAILPHLTHLRFPMLVFIFTAFIVLIVQKEVTLSWQRILTFFGLLSVIVSFYSDFTFSNLGRFALFLSILNAVLLYAVVLQRLKGEINFYLGFSPALLLVLSFFLHNSIGMLFYMIFVITAFLLLFLWHTMQTPLLKTMKLTLSIFVYSLPVVAILFMVFPRISFEKANYGFKDDLTKRSGHDGVMSLGDDALLVPSQKIVMEVYFKSGLPKNRDLYFRGSVLYVDNTENFTQLAKQTTLPLVQKARNLREKIEYDITLYPHYDKWVYALDIPITEAKNTHFIQDYTLLRHTKIEDIYRYKLTSYLHYDMYQYDMYTTKSAIKQASLQVDETRDILSATKALELIGEDDEESLDNLIAYFKTLDLTYTLKPDAFDKAKPVDSFLYGTKKGYCVHFSAAFTYMARMAQLPTRIVTGYLINSSEAYQNYLIVRESSAHAWVEVYLSEKGWTRVETTALASHIEEGSLESLGNEHLNEQEKYFKKTYLQLMYVKYVIQTWILDYSRIKQMKILENLLHDSLYLAQFIAILALFIGLSTVLALFIQTQRSSDKTLRLMQPLFKNAKRKGKIKATHQNMNDFLQSLEPLYNREKILEINTLYHQLKYAKEVSSEDEKRLKLSVKEVIKK